MDKKEVAQAQTEVANPTSLDRLASAIEALVKMNAAQPERSNDPNTLVIMQGLTEALNRVSDNQLAGAQLIAKTNREIHRPSNEVPRQVSVFNPRGNGALSPDGYEKPKLLCPMAIPYSAEDDQLTREEVELLNLLTHVPGSYVVKRIDDTKIKISVRVERALDEVTPSKLFLTHDTAFNREYHRLMPSLHSQLRQMFGQHQDPKIRQRANAILTMEEEETLIRAGKLSVAA